MKVRGSAAALGGFVVPLLLAACALTPEPPATVRASEPSSEPSSSAAEPTPATSAPPRQSDGDATDNETQSPTGGATDSATDGTRPPNWLGTRPLPRRPDGYGEVGPTPPELVNRRFTLPGTLPPPADGQFSSTITAVPAEVLARSSWHAGCPVGQDELRYVTVSFWGFDGRPHTGELLLNERATEGVVGVFRQLFEAKFPIEEMRISSAAEQNAAPTGDTNNTEAFACRPISGADRFSTTSTRFSQHAYGLAVDINPFQNPYHKGDIVVPELASSYLSRDCSRPGLICPDSAPRTAFRHLGWGWGGSWNSLKDYMHFSANGR